MIAELRKWTTLVPVLAFVLLALTWGRSLPGGLVALVAVFLAGAVLAAVHHAEVIAHRVGEPFGSLVLAVAVTIIEVALIVTLMADGSEKNATLARDTVFAAVMITCNGIVGISILVTALKHRVAVFNSEGTGAAFGAIATLAVLSLVLPTFTTSTPGPQFSPTQLVFAATASLIVYLLFVATLTVRHRDYFLAPSRQPARATADATATAVPAVSPGSPTPTQTPTPAPAPAPAPADEEHAAPPTSREAWLSLSLLGVALVSVVGLAKGVSPTIERTVADAGLPASVVGVVIAMLVLLPETISAIRSAARDRMQTSLNLAHGSALASIGLTIPAVAVASTWLSGPLVLGLDPTHMVLLALSIAVGTLTVMPGRATPLQGGVHLAVMAAYLVLAVSP
ncbi:Cation/proton antiporter [Kitasatospora sp. MMS16-BH015]|uniref:calcium:proton antiporter n=1 Tax=Kitasatospora sp. MMS16-BH015 TaxID=2018025 RepID=UPI000CA327F8|nr:ionic transporter y4hA [Kitasatospora sp. MMS16-BH015]AUG75299.1 Cation/proton antiporter [Kitasatospora sp. MMS16-BH015]